MDNGSASTNSSDGTRFGAPVMASGWLESGRALLDGSLALVRASQEFAVWLGATPEKLVGRSLVELLLAVDASWREPLDQAFAEPSSDFATVTLPALRSGHLSVELEITRVSDGFAVRLQSAIPALNELAEEGCDSVPDTEAAGRELVMRLTRAESRLEQLTQHWPGVIFSQRADYTFSYVSDGIEELTGVPIAEFASQASRFWEVIHEGDHDDLRQQIRAGLASNDPIATTFRIRNLKTNQVFYILEERRAHQTQNGIVLGFEGVWLDVTRQTIAEKRLSTASWKEALGTLTMGLAHDFSNIMAGIHAISESFVSQIDAEHPFHEGLTLVRENTQTATKLVRRLLNLQDGKPGDRSYQDLNALVKETLELMRKVIPRRVKVHFEPAKDVLPLYVDPVEFRQVAVNLCLNAVDAMPQGGELRLATRELKRTPRLALVHGHPPSGPTIRLTIEDTGHGISKDNLANIFNAFFTTKALNKGTGLGLYNARVFVEGHHGAISVKSEPGSGTCFSLWLPKADFSEAEAAPEPGTKSDTPDRHTLLLLGSSKQMLDNTAEFLRLNGFYVVNATTPERAREIQFDVQYPVDCRMLLLVGAADTAAEWLEFLRESDGRYKDIIQVSGCNQDEIARDLLAAANLVITPDLTGDQIVSSIHRLFQ